MIQRRKAIYCYSILEDNTDTNSWDLGRKDCEATLKWVAVGPLIFKTNKGCLINVVLLEQRLFYNDRVCGLKTGMHTNQCQTLKSHVDPLTYPSAATEWKPLKDTNRPMFHEIC